ncbi:MAG: hypothetical protein JNG88_11080 [Phycisphaerales bacterium]|nr:hypothetical protein [Phycisphaerales bacterium]
MATARLFHVLIALMAIVASSAAQDPAGIAEMEKLYKTVVKPDALPAKKEAAEAFAKLNGLNLPLEKLQPPQQVMLLRTAIHAAAGCGQAMAAGERAEKLRNLGGLLDAASLESVILGATVAGDAKLADEAFAELSNHAQVKDRKAVADRRRRLDLVGQSAPETSCVTDDDTIVDFASREGVVLLIDFWNMLDKPSDASVKALRGLFEVYRAEPKFLLIGINADSPARLEKAREFAKSAKFEWKQHYEEQMTNAPFTHEAFHAGRAPYQLLIDKNGYIRAVGHAGEMAFRAAVLAAVSEARGDAAVIMPREQSGQRAESREAPPVVHQTKPKDGGKLPSNPEAASMLREARAFLKTGMKTKAQELLKKIIEQYPGTQEAEEAKFLLG